ncbi:MAG: ComEA family DNA-binding protein [Pseudomonas sp.]|uniref:ComEA family DNA-binding protein n=1 Tax=Pseudomonas abieticivorans TaxID=2931382 RepID=UPI0020C0CC4B|nr:ComEA family DNA-binding protein [Pseudomonas sp. PIA16]MDE1164215.1 ComEA family DNA-binding protein [Pseudomonas sp.]
MRKLSVASILFALLSSFSLAVTAAPAPSAGAAPSTLQASSSAKVNLNSADAETLQRELSGIGLGKAQAIVAHREANGAFATVDELLEVKGIGKSLLDKNRERLTIN